MEGVIFNLSTALIVTSFLTKIRVFCYRWNHRSIQTCCCLQSSHPGSVCKTRTTLTQFPDRTHFHNNDSISPLFLLPRSTSSSFEGTICCISVLLHYLRFTLFDIYIYIYLYTPIEVIISGDVEIVHVTLNML
jgi:hypothetical protein